MENAPSERFLVMVQAVDIQVNCRLDVIIISSQARVNALIHGNLYFRGDTLTIVEDTVVEGKLKTLAKRPIVKGTIQGTLEGHPDQWEGHRRQQVYSLDLCSTTTSFRSNS